MFSGINEENLNMIIRKNNFYLDSIIRNEKKIISIFNNLVSTYNGNDLNYLFSKILNERNNVEKFSEIIRNYSDTLYSVKRNYQLQDLNTKFQINCDSSKL